MSSSTSDADKVTLTTRGKIAIITLNIPDKLNALTQDLYFRLSTLLRQVATLDDIYVTVLTGTGRYFSAGADVSLPRIPEKDTPPRQHWLRTFAAHNLEITHAFYTHPKILITALNGPAVGLSAALIASSDFIYCAPHAFLLTPFTSLGLVGEGGATKAFVDRLGISKANEALIMSRRITAEEMRAVGFVNEIVGTGRKGEEGEFLEEVLRIVRDRLGNHLNADSALEMKKLIRRPEREMMGGQTVAEVMCGLDRFVKGVPQEEFRKLASGEKKHKL
ncbi:MAG: crotonase [Lasallia pustulata]|uniref:Crotonase n=1 Tax=Lasallia pustulata TaxID=136370 RepID=A0A1W5D6V0_9LECA|nr:MAG: crotonase [Lasallia pustulata]SLM38854.1 peroxisomal-enoyl-isomerase [Lasallia pustulata]